ncbi:piezo-type mechanosensitive ion channel component 2-like [Pseudochaenichthys georgianus]|uniref:piezo-type mechanosensitive ion channel component 2-like n=1 Tax=Pseudochaenichthys georgianus TaxID=52239 RepID=UPI0039C2E19D
MITGEAEGAAPQGKAFIIKRYDEDSWLKGVGFWGNVPSKDSIHVLYQKAMKLNMSRQASLDQLSEDDSASASTRLRRRRRPYPMESQDSTASRDSISSGYTEATNLFSRQSTLEDLDGMPECIPKTSERPAQTAQDVQPRRLHLLRGQLQQLHVQ